MTNPQRILHLIDTGGPGGAETVSLNLVVGLDSSRWEHHVVVPTRDWLHTSLLERGFNSILLPSKGSFDLWYLREIVRLIRRHQIHLIQTHLFTTAVYGGVAGQICGVPVVSTIHGIVDIGDDSLKRKLKFRLMDRRQNRVVLVSRLLKEKIATRSSLREGIMRVVPNGIDTDVFRPWPDTDFRRELRVPADGILIGALGNVRVPKDYGNLLEAAVILKSRSPRYRIVIVGDIEGEPGLFEELRAKQAALGLRDMVCFAGFRDDVPRLLNNLDIYVMSSEREGLPLSMLQAMATGIPVVSTRCGGPQELIVNDLNGLLVETRAPAELAEAIHALASDPRRSSAMGAAGRQTVERNYTLERMVEQYEGIYHELLR